LASARECNKADTCATPARSPEVFGALANLPDDASIWHAAVARPSRVGLEPLFAVDTYVIELENGYAIASPGFSSRTMQVTSFVHIK